MRREEELVARAAEADLVAEIIVAEKHLVVAEALPVRPGTGGSTNRLQFFGESVNQPGGEGGSNRHCVSQRRREQAQEEQQQPHRRSRSSSRKVSD